MSLNSNIADKLLASMGALLASWLLVTATATPLIAA
jgi:hypothetical protein